MKWRPRFSLRTLLVLVTLTCIYFAAWEVTKRKGVENLAWNDPFSVDFRSPMPFVVLKSDYDVFTPIMMTHDRIVNVWFFGWTWKTPIRSEVESLIFDPIDDSD